MQEPNVSVWRSKSKKVAKNYEPVEIVSLKQILKMKRKQRKGLKEILWVTHSDDG